MTYKLKKYKQIYKREKMMFFVADFILKKLLGGKRSGGDRLIKTSVNPLLLAD